MSLIQIPDKAKLNITIPKEKLLDESSPVYDLVVSVTWFGVVKPKIMDVLPTVTERFRYEEIQFLRVEYLNRTEIYDIGKAIYSKIKYPCVIEYVCDDTTIIGCCRFNAGKIDRYENVNKEIIFSHVLREELLSPQAARMVEKINQSIVAPGEYIGGIYNSICDAVSGYMLSGTSRAHVDRLIADMVGKAIDEKAVIRKICTPYKYHAIVSGNRFSGVRTSNYILVHDYEEIWYCFMKCPRLKNVIERRRYRDIEDLIYSIDSKSWY